MTKIVVKVHPGASKNKVTKNKYDNNTPHYHYDVYLTAPAHNNKANQALVKVLSDYLNLKKSQIFITSGEKNNIKELCLFNT